LYDPVSGDVLIDGRNTQEFTCESLRAQVSVVMQDTLLFAATIRENIGFGSASATPEEIEEAARLANAHEFISRLPEGYDTVVGERGVTLSAGQRQRIAIARAAVRRSPILILDEPTTGLDEENERVVTESLHRLAQGRTTFLITHNLHHASQADLIVLLAHGRVVEVGKHEQLIERHGHYAALFRKRSAIGRPLAREEGNYALAV
jgi:ATP-binding cassette subfamily B protein